MKAAVSFPGPVVGGALTLSLALSLVLPGAAPAQARPRADEPADPETTIVVDPAQPRGPAATQLLGANHRYDKFGSGLWNPRTGAPYRAFVRGAHRLGLQSLRFPGGTIANTYDWKRAIGDHRGCQVDGRGSAATGFRAITRGLAFGPDEFMTAVEQLGAAPLIMVSFVRETPEDAADWVEYMNAPADDPGNPNGGVDWADVRAANGHAEPYGVTRWEIGNEQHHLDSRHWLSADAGTAAQEYADGASPWIADEPLGKDCSHPLDGVPSEGTPGQVFEVLYPPVDPATVEVAPDGRPTPWREVPDITATRPRARVFEVRAESGEIVFGDGTHGRVPPEGRRFHVSYTSVHEGYFGFAEAMKAVDPSIDVCASFGRISFIQAAAGRPVDCLTTHPITTLVKSSETHWADALEGHDRMMLAAAQRRRGVIKLRNALPPETPLWFTEAAAIAGDHDAYPGWATSATQAAYMATMWGDWLGLGIGWGMSSVFLGGVRAVLGPRPDVTYSAEAVTREAIGPMFRDGGDLLTVTVDGNPARHPEGMQRSYAALAVTATRSPDGIVHMMVVNRLPTDAVTATVEVPGLVTDVADVRAVRAVRYTSSNKRDAPPEVVLEVDQVPVDPAGLVYTFPPTSTTVLSLAPTP